MKKIKIVDELSNIDNKYIEKALLIDTKEKFRDEREKEKSMKFNNLFKWGSVCLGCLCLVLVGLFTFNNGNSKLMQIANPLTELKSKEEMTKYLGYEVPTIENKKISNYIVIGEGKYAEHGRIIYKDNSSFEMEKGTNKDVSGIYGGKFVKKETINNNEVSIYTMENIIYATWSDAKYSYSYSIENGTEKQLINDIKLIK